MARHRSREAETEDVNERRLRRGAVKRTHIGRWAIGVDELAPGVVGDTHLGSSAVQVIQRAAAGVTAGMSVTLSAASQTISTGGEALELTDLVVGPRRAGFDDLTLPASAMTFPVEVVATVHVRYRWDTWRAGGTVQLLRDDVVVDESPVSWGTRFDGVLHAGAVRPGEALSVVVDHGDGSSHDVTDVVVTVKVEGVPVSGVPDGEAGIYTVSFMSGENVLKLVRVTGAGSTTLAEPAFSGSPDVWYGLRASFVDGRIRARVWEWDDPEPSTWLIDVTDPDPLAPGYAGVTASPTTDTSDGRRYDTVEVTHDGGTPIYTDFSEYALGFPVGWSRLFGPGNLWEVATFIGATGGQILQYPVSALPASFLGWASAGVGRNTEIVVRCQTGDSDEAIGVLLHGTVLL